VQRSEGKFLSLNFPRHLDFNFPKMKLNGINQTKKSIGNPTQNGANIKDVSVFKKYGTGNPT